MVKFTLCCREKERIKISSDLESDVIIESAGSHFCKIASLNT